MDHPPASREYAEHQSHDKAPPYRLPTLGTRGEGWVLIQSALLSAVIATGIFGASWPERLRYARLAAAATFGAVGISLVVTGGVSLGRQLTPLPRPHARSVLKRTGIYSRVRHPIYGGVILIAFAWSFLMSPWALIPSATVPILFTLKAKLEEAWLTERFPDYPNYARRVRHRFVPNLW
jgi:protein-S-isoprenylcysteine O-methyltransferase Ste14